MQDSVDLNADMGEGFGPWQMGDDDALLRVISSANIACGFHAGDADTMAHVMGLAVENGVGIGAHPGLPDLQGFGRRRMDISPAYAGNIVRYQIGAAWAMARAAGGYVRHLKLHGALANMAAEDEALASACYEAALSVDPELILMVIAGTRQEVAARKTGGAMACEIFADRAYNPDATLVDRRQPGAVIHDGAEQCERILAMLEAGAIIAVDGSHIPTRIDTICLHGDTPSAVKNAGLLRQLLEASGVVVRPFS